MTAPAFALCTSPERLNKAGLWPILDEVAIWRGKAYAPRDTSKARMVELIGIARADYWNHQTLPKEKSTLTPSKQLIHEFTISASEVNVFLQSLPPVPMWGDQ